VSRVFAHGALRLYMLSMLEDHPRHGYELIQLLEDRFLGMYTPSAGTIYPRLSSLEEDGLVEHDVIDGKRVYRLTDAGRAELDARRDEIERITEQAAASARDLAREVRDEVRASVRDLRSELRDAVRDVRREERRSNRRDRTEREPSSIRKLRKELDAFVAGVLDDLGDLALDDDRMDAVHAALLDARMAVAQALAGLTEPEPASSTRA
jgi:DNA-binding PadR family transcriptional regulator